MSIDIHPDAKTKPLKGELLASIYFLTQGVASLLTWNAVLSTLDYYDAQFPGGRVDFVYPAAFSATSLIINFLMVWIRKKLSINARVAGCIALQVILLALLPVIASSLANSALGYWLVILVQVIIGTVNQISNSTVVGMAGFFPSKCMSQQNAGTGVGGIFPNVLRIISLVAFANAEGVTDNAEIFFYYGASAAFLVICIIIHFQFVKSEYALSILSVHMPEIRETRGLSEESYLNPTASKEEKLLESDSKQPLESNFGLLWQTFKEVKGLAIFMVILYFQTLMLFPGVMLLNNISGLDSAWQTVLMELVFNVCDTTGKYLSLKKSLIKKSVAYTVIMIRFVFFATFIIEAATTGVTIIDSTWFTFINIALFGLGNGFGTSSLFVMGPDDVEGEKKEVAGFVILNSLNLGIFIGSFCAIPLSNI